MDGHPFEWKDRSLSPFRALFSSHLQASYFCFQSNRDSELGKASLMAASVRLKAMVLMF